MIMKIEDFNKLIGEINNYNAFAREIISYSKLEDYIKDYEKERDRFLNNYEQINKSSVPEDQKEIARSQMRPVSKVSNDKLRALEQIKMHYDRYLADYREFLEINRDLAKASNKEAKEERKKELQREMMESLKVIPESLKAELQAKGKELRESITKDAPTRTAVAAAATNPKDYRAQYDDLEKEFDRILDGQIVEDIGLEDLPKYSKKCEKLEEKTKALIEAYTSSTTPIREDDLKYLNDRVPDFITKVRDRQREILMVQETKRDLRGELAVQINRAHENIKILEDEIAKLQAEITEDRVHKVDTIIIDKKIELIGLKQFEISKYVDDIKKLQDDLIMLEKGGKIVKREPVPDLRADRGLGPMPPKKGAPTPEMTPPSPGMEPPAPGMPPKKDAPKTPAKKSAPKTPKKPSSRKKGDKTPEPVVKEDTIDDLIAKGVLPKYLNREDLLYICEQLGIKVVDKDTVLTKEQIVRLQEDHEIQMALLNQRIYDRNLTKIEEYDKLIARYETILKEMNAENFSPKYMENVNDLLTKCKAEKKKYTDRNAKLLVKTRADLEKAFSGRAMRFNNNIRAQYEKLDQLQKDKEVYKSKFKQRRLDSRIKSTLKTIERLKGKKATIASKQQQIVNDNDQKYIDRVTEKLQAYLAKQKRVERSVDKINKISERIGLNKEEMRNLEEDIKNEEHFFERIGMRIEDGRIKRETSRLSNEMGREDFYGRHL